MLSFLGRLRAFWNETLTEVFVKASWPTAKELVDSTLVVIAAVALLGAVVFLCDFSLSNLVQFNAASQTLSSSVRLRWEYTPGSEFFVVYSDGRSTLGTGMPELLNRSLAVKVTKLLRF